LPQTSRSANELAQVDMRESSPPLTCWPRREQTITRLLNENDEFRRWYGADFLMLCAGCTSAPPANADAGDCLQRLPESEPVPDAGQTR
jgi:LysB family phage lysis regulatory protein